MGTELKAAEQALQAGAGALVEDVIKTLRNHPQYADLVNGLVEKTVAALVASI